MVARSVVEMDDKSAPLKDAKTAALMVELKVGPRDALMVAKMVHMKVSQ
jgi:hypothetical protein